MNAARWPRGRRVQVVEDGRNHANGRLDIVSRASPAHLAALRTVVLAVVIGLLGVLDPPTEAAGQTELSPRERTNIVGRVTGDPKKYFARIETFATYLARRLETLGITAWNGLVAKDNREMIRYLGEGKVDLVSEGVLSALLFSDEAGAEILLREWKKGIASYHTVFITREDSGIATLADLRGKKIAFEDPGSATGFLLPLAILNRAGLETVELNSPRDAVPADKVGYVFAIQEVNIATWVARGLADAGAIENHDWDRISHTPTPLKEDLQFFHRRASR